eukprot:2637897-Rhodomonas_salina.2
MAVRDLACWLPGQRSEAGRRAAAGGSGNESVRARRGGDDLSDAQRHRLHVGPAGRRPVSAGRAGFSAGDHPDTGVQCLGLAGKAGCDRKAAAVPARHGGV